MLPGYIKNQLEYIVDHYEPGQKFSIGWKGDREIYGYLYRYNLKRKKPKRFTCTQKIGKVEITVHQPRKIPKAAKQAIQQFTNRKSGAK